MFSGERLEQATAPIVQVNVMKSVIPSLYKLTCLPVKRQIPTPKQSCQNSNGYGPDWLTFFDFEDGTLYSLQIFL